jgi:holliday junction resolvase YEN1
MSLNIVPMFVFDGPKRPAFKRNKKTHTGPGRNDQLAKELIELFGFPTHSAPGEAEAECAFLQRAGIVDAVLTEDSDALMFGCGVTFRNWSSGKSSGPVTHINVYDLETIKKDSGLTPAGMVLVALMSGADYIPEGIARCGIKTALEAARGGWGDRLAAIDPDDEAAILEWREDLLWELKRNENKTFRTKHPSVHFKDEFPQREAWGFYKNPLVSCRAEADVERLKDSIYWNGGPDIQHLREYTRQNFGWGGKNGAEKFIRVMAPAMLAWRLRRDSPEDD